MVSATTTTTPVTTPLDNDAARWEQWQHHYTSSSRKTMTQMRMVFTVALIAATAFVIRAFLS